jgi:hypothetical protein
VCCCERREVGCLDESREEYERGEGWDENDDNDDLMKPERDARSPGITRMPECLIFGVNWAAWTPCVATAYQENEIVLKVDARPLNPSHRSHAALKAAVEQREEAPADWLL